MLRAVAPVIACLGMLMIVACGGRDPVDKQANNTAGLPAPDMPSPDATGARPTNDAAPAGSAPPAATTAKIPAALHGRWGLSPGDCTSTRGDAKGLLIIGPDELRFYESRAVPAANVQASADSISGDFNFTCEGQTWTRFQSLSIQRDGLVRTESNPMASFTYAKCK
jgi:hypothetical protein